ncbi:MAG TPA: hypothetical protein PLZ77_10400, partial [Lachnospiraceae bacterium]|nr:hypothetical protein [Lachnospiraceae bacterium]
KLLAMHSYYCSGLSVAMPTGCTARIVYCAERRVPWAQSYYFFEEPIETTQYKQCFDGIVQQFLL